MDAHTRVNVACPHRTRQRGAEPGAAARSGGLGACGGSPMRASFRPLATGDGDTKEKPATIVTKAEMTHGRHTTSQAEFSNAGVGAVRVQHNRCGNSPAALRNGEYWACSSQLGHLREARSQKGCGIKKASDSITQLGETVPRLEGDDSWNTCRGSAW